MWELGSQATDDFSSLYARDEDLSLKVVGVWRWSFGSGVSDFFGVAGLVWDWCCGVGGWAIKKPLPKERLNECDCRSGNDFEFANNQ